jgi:hypothetical protein
MAVLSLLSPTITDIEPVTKTNDIRMWAAATVFDAAHDFEFRDAMLLCGGMQLV